MQNPVDQLPIKTALISVSDPTKLDELVAQLDKRNVRILATGGTAKHIQELGCWVTEVSDYTDFPEIMDGRVKTLHPLIHGGMLANRDDKKHQSAMQTHQIMGIDLVVINLYPFNKVVAEGADEAKAIENIDIGGPSMIRSSAKNHRWVTVLTNPEQYEEFLEHWQENSGETSLAFRQKCAAKAFALTTRYDASISKYLGNLHNPEELTQKIVHILHKTQSLSYGENPHQKASVYWDVNAEGNQLCNTIPLHGKALSYNNLLDAAAAMRAISQFNDPAVGIIKHNSPCGLAVGKTLLEAYHKALACDPLSAFGGVIAMNRPLREEMVEAWGDLLLEVVIAPEVERTVLTGLGKRKNLRILELCASEISGLQYRSIPGGMLVQQADNIITQSHEFNVVSKTKPNKTQWRDLLFAWEAVRHIKSNAIIFARNQATVAIGGGQTSRIYSVRAAINNSQAYEGTQDSVLASDAFFPFADGVEEAIKAGAKAIIQPGGAMRDKAIIECADDYGVPMVFTGYRHFCH